MGGLYYEFARGIDERPVVAERVRKSVGCERTLEKDISRHSLLVVNLYQLTLELTERLKRHDFQGNTLTLKVKFSDFTQVTRSRTVEYVLRRKSQILPLAKALLAEVEADALPVRLLGLSVSNPVADGVRQVAVQLSLDF